MPANYWLALAKIKPVKTAQALTMPILIMQGGRDYQVTTKDLAGWKQGLEGHKNVSFRFYPALNHLFIAGKGASGPAEYLQVGHVSGKVIEDIARWVLQARL